jgi:hypothetical protein
MDVIPSAAEGSPVESSRRRNLPPYAGCWLQREILRFRFAPLRMTCFGAVLSYHESVPGADVALLRMTFLEGFGFLHAAPAFRILSFATGTERGCRTLADIP